MVTVSTLVDLYKHMEWADSRIWRVIPNLESSSPDPTLHKRLFHVHFTQLAFLGVWRGEDFAMRKADEFSTSGSILVEARTFYPA
ncbi:MAG: hypothetical protein HKN13_04425, partial [Rhodothermales bacterium]|nr:hypothetical protein [Rhodothermales bacterium]